MRPRVRRERHPRSLQRLQLIDTHVHRAPADLRRPECVELVRFALEDRYPALRREAGLPVGEG